MQGKVEICGVNTSKLKVLKNEETMELLRRTKEGDMEAREQLIAGNLRLVLSVIQKFSNRGENLDDLFQVGCIGLIKAIDNFNTDLDVRFSTYGVPMIIGEIRRYLRDNSSVRVSRSMRDTAYKVLQVRDKYLAYINQLLTNYDINYRTYRGTVRDTREEADLLRREESGIAAVWSQVRADDEQSMLGAKAELEKFTTFLRDENIARIDQLLSEYDVAIRSFNGVLYQTREEAALNRSEYNEIGSIMATVYPDNEQSMLDALMRINQMKTAYKNPVLDNLNQMWNAYDQSMRTYQGILFETRAQAENARQTREEFYRMAYSMDLSQPGSLVTLDNYIEDRLNPGIRQEAAAFVIGGMHAGHILIRTGQGRDTGFLHRGIGGQEKVLHQGLHGAHEVAGHDEVTQAPSGHGVGLGKAADDHGIVRVFQDGVLFRIPVGQAMVDLVGNDHGA